MGDSSKSSKNKAPKLLIDLENEENSIFKIINRPSNNYRHFKVTDAQVFGLNKEQKKMVVDITAYLNNDLDIPFFLVQGSGGTGKSYSINRALKFVGIREIIAAAPSHFAKNVLKDFLGKGYKVRTIASLLGKKVTYNNEGKEILVPIRGMKPPILEHPVVLIDEGSMIDDETYEEIMEYVEEGGKKLIVLGDYCQLPPVNQQTDSLFFQHISAELIQPMRFTGPIYDISKYVRQEIVNIRHGLVPKLNILNIATDRISKIDETGSGYIFLNRMGTLLKAAIRRFKMGKGPNYARVVAYRNKTIDQVNHHIRVGLYGEHSKQFEEGELLINKGGYTVIQDKAPVQIISNGSIFEVKKALPVVGPYDIPCVSLYFKGENFDHPIITVSNEGKDLYNRIERRLRKIAKNDPPYWKEYYAFKGSFAYFSYNYATSSHKVQGSSIKHVYVLEDDIYAVRPTTAKEKLQSLYVSITRAEYRLYIYNKEFSVNNKELDRELLLLDYDG